MADVRCYSALHYAWVLPPNLAHAIAQGTTIDVIYLHIPFACEFEAERGRGPHAALLANLVGSLQKTLESTGKPFGVQAWPMDDLVVWLGDWDNKGLSAQQWLRERVRDAFRSIEIPANFSARLGELSTCQERLPLEPHRDPLRVFSELLTTVQRGACDPIAREHQRQADLMEEALRRRAFVFHYQPIVDIPNQRVIAHEALCRGTLDALRFPDVIFGAAERTQKVWDLGRVLRDLIADALDNFTSDSTNHALMFLNVHPSDIDDPVFLEQALSGGLQRHAHRVVLELTERAAIRDYRRVKAFFQTLRRHGYRLAIDDLGSGYAGLTALAELEPDFIKFDMGLIRDLHLHPVKQRLIERMHDFAEEIGAETISEGVECVEERDALLETGCNVMQGYFFARPAPALANVPSERFPESTRAHDEPPRSSLVS